MKLTFISDTHSLHHSMLLDSGDVLVHCGDFTGRGNLDEVEGFAEFMAEQNFRHKVVIAGNHDWCFEDHRRKDAEQILTDAGLIYLNDSGVEIEGVKFWGSPVQPEFNAWAFNCFRGAEIRQHWDVIPDDTDVLITHGPAFGILDWCAHGERVGCEELLSAIQRIQPKVHACGHIHESYGVQEQVGTVFVNASVLDERYRLKNFPVELIV